jgi:hypothetical protein
LAVELGVSRRQLYRWRDELDPDEAVVGKPPVKNSRASALRKEVNPKQVCCKCAVRFSPK